MKVVLAIALIAVLTYLTMNGLSWWTCGIIAFLIGLLFRLSPGGGFLAGFLSVGFVWSIVALLIDSANAHVLSEKIGSIFGGIGPILLVVITGLIGGITSGFAGMAGGSLSTVLFRNASPPSR